MAQQHIDIRLYTLIKKHLLRRRTYHASHTTRLLAITQNFRNGRLIRMNRKEDSVGSRQLAKRLSLDAQKSLAHFVIQAPGIRKTQLSGNQRHPTAHFPTQNK